MRRVFFTILVICIGCGSIPSVVFVPDDAGSNGDGGTVDEGGGDAPIIESGPPMCGSNPLPDGATCCAGIVACVGDCSKPGVCKQECESLGCGGRGQVCCRGAGSAHCINLSDACQ